MLATGCEDKNVRVYYLPASTDMPLKVFTGKNLVIYLSNCPFFPPFINPYNILLSYPCPLIHSSIQPFLTPFLHPFLLHHPHHSSTHLSIHPSIHSFVSSSLHPSIHPFIHKSIHLPMHSFFLLTI